MAHATRSTKGPSTSVMAEHTDEATQDETSLHEESEPEQEVFTHNPQPNVHQPVYTNMYMPYIEGPKMDWMVNDALYHKFLKWKLKCENTLECELAALPWNAKSARKLSLGIRCSYWNESVHILGIIQRRNESSHNLGEV